eukprot:symbB.v1.2.034969.t1/scaffold4540.1/size38269/2
MSSVCCAIVEVNLIPTSIGTLKRHATKKPNIIVFQGGYHGRTLLTMSMTSSGTKYRAGYGPHASGVFVAPHPFFAFRSCPSHPDHAAWVVEQLEMMLQQQTAASETAAVVLEPVLGEGGYVPPAPGLLKGIRDFCDRPSPQAIQRLIFVSRN